MPLIFGEFQSSTACDATRLNEAISFVADEGGGDIILAARHYRIGSSIVLKTGVRLKGEGAHGTRLIGTSALDGPVVVSEAAEQLIEQNAWLHGEKVPVRFGLFDLTIDGGEGQSSKAFGSGCGAFVYGKAFEIIGVQIIHCKKQGLVSWGSPRGGQDTWLDEPEAIFDVRISRCGGDGFLMRGPHDSIIKSAIIANCKGRGLAVETNGTTYNGACDIDFCHAYGTNDVAIDIAAKVKARFLQGDTGWHSAIRVSSSEMTMIEMVECFKTRGIYDDFALDVSAMNCQIGVARIRSDWGTGGVRITGVGTQIGQLDVDGRAGIGGPSEGEPNSGTAVSIEANRVQIPSFNIRNFEDGYGIRVAPGKRFVWLTGQFMRCGKPMVAKDHEYCNFRVNVPVREE
ncbi:MAG: hypothetical protein NXH70_00710 [Hyphomonas sp.]|nr:hypothetical protein [Hyphomonas sp.]